MNTSDTRPTADSTDASLTRTARCEYDVGESVARICESDSTSTAGPVAFGSAIACGTIHAGSAGSLTNASDAIWISRSGCSAGCSADADPPGASGDTTAGASCAVAVAATTAMTTRRPARRTSAAIIERRASITVPSEDQRCHVSRSVAMRLKTGRSIVESTRSATK